MINANNCTKNKNFLNVKSKSISYYTIFFIVVFLLISTIFSTSITSNFDEIITVISGMCLLCCFITSKLKKRLLPMLVLLMLIIVNGLISNQISGISRNWFQICVDIVTTIKPFVIFGFIFQVGKKIEMIQLKRLFSQLAKIILLVFFSCFILNSLRIVEFSDSIVFGIRNFSMFGFAGNFGILIFSLFGVVVKNDISIFRQPYFWICLVMILFCFKAQAIFFVLLFIVIHILTIANKKKVNLKLVFVAAVAAVPWMLPKLLNYFATTEYSPRRIFFVDSFILLKKYFPFGTGFGTFGSPIASQDFSPLYLLLGYSNYYGMGANDETFFLNDNFLASILGQFGFLGIILFLIVSVQLLRFLLTNSISSNVLVFNVTSIIALLGTTIASSFFTSSIGALLVVVVAINYMTSK